jgi:hypothetical protein
MNIMVLPAGQLKILSIVNLCMYFIDNHNQVCILPITNPFLRFCMEVISGCFDTAHNIYHNVDPSLKGYFDEVLRLHDVAPANIKP